MIELNEIQQRAYARFIKARDRVGLGSTKPNKNYSWVPLSDYSACVDVGKVPDIVHKIKEDK